MGIRSYRPQIKVTLLKNVRDDTGVSKRYTGTGNHIDLTPFLGDLGGVTTSKYINQAMGTFNITFADQEWTQTLDSLYGSIAPMDGIEIRMARSPENYSGQLPIIMRGFVTDIRRTESMGNDGRPVRAVSVSGTDYGKAFANAQIFYTAALVTGHDLTTQFRLFELTGIQQAALTAGKFFTQLTDKIVNPYLERMLVQRPGGKPDTQIRTDVQTGGNAVFLYHLDPTDRAIWKLMAEHADLAWHELFLDDREDAPYLVYRRKPYKDLYTGQPLPGAPTVATCATVKAEDIKTMQVDRSDTDVANVYWAELDYGSVIADPTLKASTMAADDGTVFVQDYPNCDPKLFGERVMTAEMRQIPDSIAGQPINLPKAQQQQQQSNADVIALARARREQLIAMNRDNALFESGSINLKGNEAVRIGTYLEVHRGRLKSEYYVQGVTHEFMPYRSYTTRVDVIRGTGYYERTRALKSPWATEGRDGVYA